MAFRGTYTSGIIGIPGGSTNPILFEDPTVPAIQSYCEVTDPGVFSNYVETLYHDVGHGHIGGIMAEHNSPAVLVFWPWHAWVDELWYAWEASDCEGGYSESPYWANIDIFEDITWSGEHFVKGEVVVRDGATLTITSDAVIHFRDSDYESYVTRIVVEPGGRLVVNGGKLTGIDRFGTAGDGGGGVEYHTGWRGIVVQGTGQAGGNHGQVILKDATIEHAQTGILSENGGKIVAVDVNFKNCRVGVDIRNYPHTDGNFLLNVCSFSNNEPLRDVTWKSAPINGETRYVNFRHSKTESTEFHIKLDNVYRVQIIGCDFSNEFKDPNPGFGATGIFAKGLSTFDCMGGSFTGLAYGIVGQHCGPNSPTIRGGTFTDNIAAIKLNSCTAALVADNDFQLGNDQKNEGIEVINSSWLGINNNTFDGAGTNPEIGQRAMLVENAQQDQNDKIPNSIRENTFTGSPIQIQFQGGNQKIQFSCNSFNSFQRAVALAFGSLPAQGNCGLGMPAGNVWDNFGCNGDDNQLFRNSNAGTYTYSSHSDRLPTCVSSGISVIPCAYTYAQKPTCGPEQSCNPPCDEEAINDLETEKDAVSNNHALSEAEKSAQIEILGHQQQVIAQAGLTAAIESDSTLNAALAYIELLEDEFTFDASQHIFLYLQVGDTAAAAQVINALPSGNDKTLWQLYYTLHNEGRSYSELTTTEQQIVENIAQGTDWPSARAQAILAGMKDEILDVVAEPLDAASFGQQAEFRKANSTPEESRLICRPNPSIGEAIVQYLLPDHCRQAQFLMTDIFGRVVLEKTLSPIYPRGEILLGHDYLANGTYFGHLLSDKHSVADIKISFIR